MDTSIAKDLALNAISTPDKIAVSIHSHGGAMGNDIQLMPHDVFEVWLQDNLENGATMEAAGKNTVLIREDVNAFAVYPTNLAQ